MKKYNVMVLRNKKQLQGSCSQTVIWSRIEGMIFKLKTENYMELFWGLEFEIH